MSAQITLSPETLKAVDQYSGEEGCSRSEAVNKLVTIAINRINTLRRHSKKQAAKKQIEKPAKKIAKSLKEVRTEMKAAVKKGVKVKAVAPRVRKGGKPGNGIKLAPAAEAVAQ